MNRQATATILVIAFTLLTLCGWGFFMLSGDHSMMPMPNLLGHIQQYNAFIGSLLVAAFSVAFALLGFLAFLVLAPTFGKILVPAVRLRHSATPLELLWRPLQLAFSDGILNPKAY